MPDILLYSSVESNLPAPTTLAKPVAHNLNYFRQCHPAALGELRGYLFSETEAVDISGKREH
jgi:hypothetical protein